jgi:hypothetical protein
MKKRAANVLWIIAAVVALSLAINYEKTIDLLVRYVLVGNEFTWNGFTVKVDNSKRVQWPYTDQSVYIVSRNDRESYVQLHIPPNQVDAKAIITDICKQEKCGGVLESSRQTNDRHVVTFDLAMGSPAGKQIQKFVLVDGSPIWIRYQGSESGYMEFESTINGLVSDIAKVTKDVPGQSSK